VARAVVNLATLLLAHASRDPEAMALSSEDGVLSYGELARRAAAVTAGLATRAIGPGDRVALAASNTPAFVVAYLGVLGAGAVAVPLNPLAPSPELARQLALVEPSIVVRPASTDLATEATVTVEELVTDADARAPVDRADTDLAALLFTSGTDGAAMAAMLTHGSLAANVRQILGHAVLAPRPDDVVLGVLPMSHVFGLNAVLGTALAAGARVALAPVFDAVTTRALVTRERASIVAAVPTTYADWAADDAPADAFASVRLAVSGAAPLDEAVAATLADRFGLVVRQGYGLTEASPIVSSSVGLDPDPGPASIGTPLAGVEVRLVDADGEPTIPGDPGEIWVRGANVFAGYWCAPEATARALTVDGWLRTGDVATVDEHGYLTLVDRMRDLIIVSGFNVTPAEIERVVRADPDVADAAVVGENDPRTGQTPVAYVVARPGRAPTAEALIERCRRELARYKVPTRVELVTRIPRSDAGKLLRRALRSTE